jgi:hypothetical protein
LVTCEISGERGHTYALDIGARKVQCVGVTLSPREARGDFPKEEWVMHTKEEMLSCRHCHTSWKYDWEYCPECNRNYGGAVYPSTQTDEEVSEVKTLISEICEAFDGTTLADGTTIHEADLEGAYSEDSVRLEARGKDSETNWQSVSDRKLERFHSALSFFDVRGWKFYIPAYMIWSLRNWRTTDSLTADSVIWGFELRNEYRLPRFESLSERQSKVVLAFLQHFCKYSWDPDAEKSINSYWKTFA